MTKFKRVFGDILEGIGVYVCTFLGIIFAQYGPSLLQPMEINIALQWARIILSALAAFYLVINDENRGDEVGRKNNLKRRLGNAFKEGIQWNVIMGIGVNVIRQAGA